MALPPFAELTTGGLSTGAKKPLNVYPRGPTFHVLAAAVRTVTCVVPAPLAMQGDGSATPAAVQAASMGIPFRKITAGTNDGSMVKTITSGLLALVAAVDTID